MKRLSILITSMCAVAMSLSALTVENTAGKLESAMKGMSSVTELAVTGSVNAADMKYIANELTDLQSLDLSGATIAAYDGLAINGHTGYPANTIPAAIFAGGEFTTVQLPAAAGLVIGEGAFASSALESITLGANIAEIGMGAFSGCQHLATATISATRLALPENVFSDCTALATVTGSTNIASIGASAFSGCQALTEFGFGAVLTTIGANAFEGSGLTSADFIPAVALETIGAWAFANSPLEEIKFNKKVAEIGQGAFYNCSKLTTINPSVRGSEIPAYAFAKDAAVTSDYLLGDDVETIGNYAMKGMSGIKDLMLSPGLSYIGDGAMEGMSGLTSIGATALSAVPALGEGVWDGIDQSVVQLSAYSELIEDFRNAEQWKEFNIVTATVGPKVENDDTNSFRCGFQGDVLVVEVLADNVKALALYNLTGRVLNGSAVSGSGVYTIDTAAYADTYYILAVSMADGSVRGVKVAR